jgi:hypothetical protein
MTYVGSDCRLVLSVLNEHELLNLVCQVKSIIMHNLNYGG